jgi:hypothetical protein
LITVTVRYCPLIIIIIIIIGKDTISFMQGIYTYIPETNHVPKQYNVAAIIIIIIIIISSSSSISIQLLGRFWQEPEPSQATGMALASCILDKFLGVVCNCFPCLQTFPLFPTTRAFLVAKAGTVGENGPVILPK